MSGPQVRSPDGLVDMTLPAQRYGLQGQVFADVDTWIAYCEGGSAKELAVIESLVSGMDALLASDRADYAYFDFKHWYHKSSRSTKADWTRLRATMYVTEEGRPWVCLTTSPKKAHRWRGHSLA